MPASLCRPSSRVAPSFRTSLTATSPAFERRRATGRARSPWGCATVSYTSGVFRRTTKSPTDAPKPKPQEANLARARRDHAEAHIIDALESRAPVGCRAASEIAPAFGVRVLEAPLSLRRDTPTLAPRQPVPRSQSAGETGRTPNAGAQSSSVPIFRGPVAADGRTHSPGRRSWAAGSDWPIAALYSAAGANDSRAHAKCSSTLVRGLSAIALPWARHPGRDITLRSRRGNRGGRSLPPLSRHRSSVTTEHPVRPVPHSRGWKMAEFTRARTYSRQRQKGTEMNSPKPVSRPRSLCLCASVVTPMPGQTPGQATRPTSCRPRALTRRLFTRSGDPKGCRDSWARGLLPLPGHRGSASSRPSASSSTHRCRNCRC